jgi:hypothetical protein
MSLRAILAGALLPAMLAACGGAAPQQNAQGGMFGTAGAAKGSVAEAPKPVPANGSSSEEAASSEEAEDSPDSSSQPVSGSAQRAALMNALRPAIERELGGPIEFVVSRADVRDGWALVIADPQRPGGGAITPPAGFDSEFRDGLTVNGVLRFSGNGWTLVDHAIGPTDVWYCGLDGPPRALTGC